MPNINELFPSKYLRAGDLGDREFAVVIDRVVVEQMPEIKNGRQTNRKEDKLLIYFRSAQKALICSEHNAKAIAELYGPETDDWVGKRLTLYVEFGVQAFGKSHNVVRVKPTAVKDIDNGGQVERGADDEAPPAADFEPEPSPAFKSPASWEMSEAEIAAESAADKMHRGKLISTCVDLETALDFPDRNATRIKNIGTANIDAAFHSQLLSYKAALETEYNSRRS